MRNVSCRCRCLSPKRFCRLLKRDVPQRRYGRTRAVVGRAAPPLRNSSSLPRCATSAFSSWLSRGEPHGGYFSIPNQHTNSMSSSEMGGSGSGVSTGSNPVPSTCSIKKREASVLVR